MLIGLDNGYWATKFYNGTSKKSILSRVTQAEGVFEKLDSDEETGRFTVKYQDKVYQVGEGIKECDIRLDKTESDFHKILTLTALSTLVNITGTFDVVAGLPINIYRHQRNKFAEYLKTKGEEEITVNKHNKKILVRNVTTYPQAVGAAYSKPEWIKKFKNTKVGLIDWGGHTIDGCVLNSLEVVPDSVFSIEYGTHAVYANIAKEITATHTVPLNQDSISSIVQKGSINKRGRDINVKEIVMASEAKCVQEVLTHCINSFWEVDTMPIVHTGGGILVSGMRETIDKIIGQGDYSDEPVYDNSTGFFRVAQAIYK